MGCSVSVEPPPQSEQHGGHRAHHLRSLDEAKGGNDDDLHSTRRAAAEGATGRPDQPKAKGGGASKTPCDRLPGKFKYIAEYGALVMNDKRSGGQLRGLLIVYCEPVHGHLTLSYREEQSGFVYTKEYSDERLIEEKEAAGIHTTWGPFFKSIAIELLKGKATISVPNSRRKEVNFVITSSKEPDATYYLTLSLDLVSRGNPASDRIAEMTYVLIPMARRIQSRRLDTEKSNESQISQLQIDRKVRNASITRLKDSADRLLQYIQPLREESAAVVQTTMELLREVNQVERKIRLLREGMQTKDPLDRLYSEGGAQYFKHLPCADRHYPQEIEPEGTLSACIRSTFPLGNTPLDSVPRSLGKPELQQILRDAPRHMIDEVFRIFRGLDSWDYNAIQLEIITSGNALFYTTYALLYKLNLVSHFRIDDQVLRNFLTAVQAGYHPNPYHNSMHAADVTQVNYYIITEGGLREKLKLSQEEMLAAVLAGAIHDFDHPGFNNNFHSKTNAYLAILYNDRSILENHHCACVFEILRKPKYDIFANLSEEQRLIVRETMLEMVLSTDMGNHGKIFKSFQTRVSEVTDWSAKKEDVRLALSMSIKMADISNCARPTTIYSEWAKNIAQEFYNQGDWEAKLKLPISPFMDRTRHKTEFSKGQISFVMYVVQPTLEGLAELLPRMKFAKRYCMENKDYWQQQEAQEAEALE